VDRISSSGQPIRCGLPAGRYGEGLTDRTKSRTYEMSCRAFDLDNSFGISYGMDVARMGEKRNTCTVLVGRPQGRPLKRPGRTRANNIKMD